MPDTALILESTITCPKCGHRATETMPTAACHFFYDCKACGALLKPKAGDCCVFCSYGSVPCPPIQAGHGGPTCCAGDAATVEIRPCVQRPDWSVVTRAAARDARLAGDRSRPGPAAAWSKGLPQLHDAVWRATIALFARLGRPPRREEIAVEMNLGECAIERIPVEHLEEWRTNKQSLPSEDGSRSPMPWRSGARCLRRFSSRHRMMEPEIRLTRYLVEA